MPRDLQPEGHGRRNFSKCHLFCASPLHYSHERRFVSCSDHLVCEKSQSLKNVVKKNRSRDHHQLQPLKLGASGLQRFCLGWSWKLIFCWKRPLWHLQRLLLCLRNGKEKPGEILALLAHLFLLLATTLGNLDLGFESRWMRGLLRRIITSVLDSKGWVVEKYFKN